MSTTYWAPRALIGDDWMADVTLAVGDDGCIAEITPETPCDPGSVRLSGAVIPGMINLHSHAFQRAFAGLTEVRSGDDDSFWTWREQMYRFARNVRPDELQAIARWLYIEMLRGGFTRVCEFHYLHHGADGVRYADPAEMSLQLAQAGVSAGIGLTLLPVLYERAGFAQDAPTAAQRQFCCSVDEYLALVTRLAERVDFAVGVAFHSLRAVAPASLAAVQDAADDALPMHIHIAEQTAEVDDCLAATGARPVQWLMDHCAVSERWCLVHATHLDEQEITSAAAAGAVAGLCPTTEANLGDGLFPLEAWAAAGGRFGVGTDSHVGRSAPRELELLEYGQRLSRRRRNVSAPTVGAHTGATLWRAAAAVGSSVAGVPCGRLEAGWRADFCVLETPVHAAGDVALDLLVFGGEHGMIRDVYCAGHPRIVDGRHAEDESASRAFAAAVDRIITETR